MSKSKKRTVLKNSKRRTTIETLEKRELFSVVGWDCPAMTSLSNEPAAIVSSPQPAPSEQLPLATESTDDRAVCHDILYFSVRVLVTLRLRRL